MPLMMRLSSSRSGAPIPSAHEVRYGPIARGRVRLHSLTAVGFFYRRENKHGSREDGVKVWPDCRTAIGSEKLELHAGAELIAGTLRKPMVRPHYRTQHANTPGKHLE